MQKGVVVIISKNSKIITTVCDVASNGDGVAKVDGYPLFVKGGVTGDELEIVVTKTNKNYGFGKIEKIIKPSDFRTTPVCPQFGKCGGCDFMHIKYTQQLEIKKNFVVENMKKIGGILPDEYIFEGIIGAENTLNYRNKAQFPVRQNGKKTVCGFFSKKSHDIIECNNCAIQNNTINQIVAEVMEYISKNHIAPYDEKSHKGIVRHIYVRGGGDGDECMVVLVTNSTKPLKNVNQLVENLTSKYNVKTIVQNINTKKSNLILGDENRIISGSETIKISIGDMSFCISPNSFFQVNSFQTQKLYQKALEYADINNTETVFDLYCGVGSISLFLARAAKKVIGVEIVPDAVENAKKNAELNNITNAEFYCGDSAEVTNELIKNGESADVVVIDPPRKGASQDLIDLICQMQPKRLVYVSCNDATLARDVAILKQKGYILQKLCAVDMFPQSGHVETVVLMSKVNTTM